MKTPYSDDSLPEPPEEDWGEEHADPQEPPPAEVTAEAAPQANVRMVSDGDSGVAGEKHG